MNYDVTKEDFKELKRVLKNIRVRGKVDCGGNDDAFVVGNQRGLACDNRCTGNERLGDVINFVLTVSAEKAQRTLLPSCNCVTA